VAVVPLVSVIVVLISSRQGRATRRWFPPTCPRDPIDDSSRKTLDSQS
jgi:hypothetical protein